MRYLRKLYKILVLCKQQFGIKNIIQLLVGVNFQITSKFVSFVIYFIQLSCILLKQNKQ